MLEPLDAIEEAMKLSVEEAAFWEDAGPTVLRLKLLEVMTILHQSDIQGDIRATAISAAAELRRLIAERPSISFVDAAAKRQVLEESEKLFFAPLPTHRSVTDLP